MKSSNLLGQEIPFPKISVKIHEVLFQSESVSKFLVHDCFSTPYMVKYFNLLQNSQDFQRELGILQKLRTHPHVVELKDCIQEDESAAFLYELPSKGLLKNYLVSVKLNEDQITALLNDLLQAIIYFHSMGILVRNISLESIYVTEDWIFKLGEFGSCIMESELRDFYGGEVVEDIEAFVDAKYRAPEELDLGTQNPVGIESDMWRVGCFLYEMLFNEYPFPNKEADILAVNFKRPQKKVSESWVSMLQQLFCLNTQERIKAPKLLELLNKQPQSPQTNQTAIGSFFSIGNFFNKSSNSVVKSLTSDSSSPFEQEAVNKLIEKAWKKPFKINKVYKALLSRPYAKTTVALKCLVLEHNYLCKGPKQCIQEECAVLSDNVYINWSSSKHKKDKLASDAIKAAIKTYAQTLKEKFELHVETGCNGDWREGEVLDINLLNKFYSYLDNLISLTKMMVLGQDLSELRGQACEVLLLEQINSVRFISEEIKKLKTEQRNEMSQKLEEQRQASVLLYDMVHDKYPRLTLPEISDLSQSSQSLLNSTKGKNRNALFGDLTYVSQSSDTVFTGSVDSTPQSGSSLHTEDSQSYTSGNSIKTPDTPGDSWQDMKSAPWAIDPEDLHKENSIAIGSSCTVYKGSYKFTPVAIKVLNNSISGSLNKEFDRELQALTKLRHPNLVLFMGACLEEPLTIVTEFCAGDTLFSLLHEKVGVQVSLKQKLKIAKDIAQGMAYLHSMNPPVIHRDLKSLNLLLSDPLNSPNDHVTVKITDFGVSRMVGEYMTGQQGTCHWMAPEVLASQPYSLAADVYSYAIVLWEIFARETPYKGTNHVMIPYQVLYHGARPELSWIKDEIPDPLKNLITQAWDANPQSRPSFPEIINILNSIQV